MVGCYWCWGDGFADVVAVMRVVLGWIYKLRADVPPLSSWDFRLALLGINLNYGKAVKGIFFSAIPVLNIVFFSY